MAPRRASVRSEQARDYQLGSSPLRKRGAILVVDGFATSLRVERGRLVVRSGAGRQISERRFSRTDGISRILVLGRAGTLTLAALGWAADLGIALICLDRDSRALAHSAQLGRDDARLRRAQALAADTPLGVELGRLLLERKLLGQRNLLEQLPELDDAAQAAHTTIGSTLAALERAETIEQLRAAEAQAAKAYWGAWARVPVSFARKDADRVPEGWRLFGSRRSPLTGGPRLAATPGNALANLLYALAEQEASLALRALGLDPGLGIVHHDQPARDSLALDLLDAIRPQVDHYLVDLLRGYTFAATDFYESRRGNVRVLPPLSHQLAQTLPLWAEQTAPIAEQLAETLLNGRAAGP